MNPLNIFINLFKRGDGAEQAKASLEDVQQATEKVNREQQSLVDVASASQKILASFGAQTGPLSRGILALARSFRVLGESMGIAMTAGFKKIADAILFVIALLGTLWGVLGNRGSGMADAAAEADAVDESFGRVSSSADSAGSALGRHADAAATAAEKEREFHDALKRSESASKSYTNALSELEAAHKNNAIANLDLLKSKREISDYDYDVQRARIETGSALSVLERERTSIEEQSAEKHRTFSAMEGDFATTSTEAKRRKEEYQAAGGDAALAEAQAVEAAAQKAVEKAKDDFARQSRTYMSGGITPELFNASVRHKDEAESAAQDASARREQLQALKAQADEANRAATAARERFLSEGPTIETELQGLRKRRESVAINIETEKTIGTAKENEAFQREKKRVDAENERLKKEQEDGMETWAKWRLQQENNMDPRQRLKRVIDDVQPVAQLPQGRAGEDIGRATQARARDAIQQAGERIQAGEDNRAVLDALVGTLQRLGAVMGRLNLSALVQQLDMLDGKIDMLENQVKNGRD